MIVLDVCVFMCVLDCTACVIHWLGKNMNHFYLCVCLRACVCVRVYTHVHATACMSFLLLPLCAGRLPLANVLNQSVLTLSLM